MGAQVSTNTNVNELITNAIASSLITNNSSCGTQAGQSQAIKFGTVKGNFTLNGAELGQNASVNLSCLQSSTNTSSLESAITDKLEQLAKAENSGQNVGGQVVLNTNQSKIVHNIALSLNIENIKTCLASFNQSQIVGAEFVGGNVDLTNIKMNQAVNLVASCIQKDNNVAKLINDLATTVKQESESKNVGFLNSSTIWAIALIVIGVIVIIILLWFMKKALFSGGGSNTSATNIITGAAATQAATAAKSPS